MTGDDLRRVRRDLQLSQEALAKRLGMTRSPVAEWEAGKRSVPRYIELATRGDLPSRIVKFFVSTCTKKGQEGF
jgi:transcriptional regulator with XRE-family HTH domain